LGDQNPNLDMAMSRRGGERVGITTERPEEWAHVKKISPFKGVNKLKTSTNVTARLYTRRQKLEYLALHKDSEHLFITGSYIIHQ
jgi:hypothetical protein